MEIDLVSLENALEVLGQLLADRELHYEVAAVGGGSLLLLGLIERPTRDLDLVALIKDHALISANPLPSPLVQAVEEVGKALDLGKDWLNIVAFTLSPEELAEFVTLTSLLVREAPFEEVKGQLVAAFQEQFHRV